MTLQVIGITPAGMIRLRGLPPYGGTATRPADRVPIVPPLSPDRPAPATPGGFLDERRAAELAALTPELRAALADYHVLQAYDLARVGRYGDMAASRRALELNRRGDALLKAGVPIDRDGNFPPATSAELAEAWARTIEPRRRRFAGEPGAKFRTPHARATAHAYALAAHRLGIERLER